VLAIVLLLLGAKRIPELAKSLGACIKELREGNSTGDEVEAEALESKEARSVTRAGSVGESVGARAGQRGL
jgi:TatA/E family protein of Tat protein translocase